MSLILRVVCALGTIASVAFAQLLPPAVTVDGPRHYDVQQFSADALANLTFEDMRADGTAIQFIRGYFPHDSLVQQSIARARVWMTTLHNNPRYGLQLDASGKVAVRAQQEDVAEHDIATRLATPGLTLADRAFTLQMAVEAFTSTDFPARLPIAERYVAQLDALGADGAYWQYRARSVLLNTYYLLGRTSDAVRIGLQLVHLVSVLPFPYRGGPGSNIYDKEGDLVYGMILDAVGAHPNGAATIRALNAELLAATTPPASLVAFDSTFFWNGEDWKGKMQLRVKTTNQIGQQGAPLSASYWVNRGVTRDTSREARQRTQSIAVNDGTIRVIEVGNIGCGPCIAAIPAMERLHHQFPDVEFNFLTWTSGFWGNRVVEPVEEAEKLTAHLVTTLHVTYPIGVVFAPHVPQADGSSPTRLLLPTFDQYPEIGTPTIYLVDGHGVVRKIISGYSHELENVIVTGIEFLRRNATLPSS